MTGLLALRGLAEYVRRPLNLVLLAVVPVVFVTLSAGTLADFASALGGGAETGAIEAATAGWAAAILAGVGGFFHVAGSREPDRRLAASGAGALRVVVARIGSAFVLAAIAAAGALVALMIRTGLGDAPQIIAATLLFAVIYLAIGTAVGALVRSEMNGSLLIITIWVFDVFLSPAMGAVDAGALRALPLHFPTGVVTDLASGHAGRFGDLGISLVWAVGGLGLAIAALVATTRPSRIGAARRPRTAAQLLGGLRYGFREYRRNVSLWVVLVGLPLAFITVGIAVTPDRPVPVELTENGRRAVEVLPLPEVHGALMASMTVAIVAGLAGLFVVSGSAEADRRLVLAGFRARGVLAARLGVITFATLLAVAVSLAVTAPSFSPRNWLVFTVGNVLVAITYAMLGVMLGPVFGRLGGLYVMVLLPLMDTGLGQNPLFASPAWGRFMPAYGSTRVVLDGAFTPTFDDTAALVLALGWLAVVTAIAAAVFRRLAEPARA